MVVLQENGLRADDHQAISSWEQARAACITETGSVRVA